MKRPSELFACGVSCLLLVLANTAGHRDSALVPVQAHVVESKSPRSALAYSPQRLITSQSWRAWMLADQP